MVQMVEVNHYMTGCYFPSLEGQFDRRKQETFNMIRTVYWPGGLGVAPVTGSL